MDRELTITVSDDDARLIEERVKSGAFTSPSEVVKAGLAAMQDFEEAERRETVWLRAKVDEALNDPRPPVPADEAFASIRAHIPSRNG